MPVHLQRLQPDHGRALRARARRVRRLRHGPPADGRERAPPRAGGRGVGVLPGRVRARRAQPVHVPVLEWPHGDAARRRHVRQHGPRASGRPQPTVEPRASAGRLPHRGQRGRGLPGRRVRRPAFPPEPPTDELAPLPPVRRPPHAVDGRALPGVGERTRGEKPPWARRGVIFGLATTMREGDAAEWCETRPEPSKDAIVALARTSTTLDLFPQQLCERLMHRGWWLTGATLSQYHRELLPAELPRGPTRAHDRGRGSGPRRAAREAPARAGEQPSGAEVDLRLPRRGDRGHVGRGAGRGPRGRHRARRELV